MLLKRFHMMVALYNHYKDAHNMIPSWSRAFSAKKYEVVSVDKDMDTLRGYFFIIKLTFKFMIASNSIWRSKFDMLADNVKVIEQLRNPSPISIDSD